MPEDLNADCDYCGRPNWEHLERRVPHGKDLMPCEPMLIDRIGEESYQRNADENGNCRKCGKPLRNHLVFERYGVKVMGVTIWNPSETAFLDPVAEIPCNLVSDEGPLLGRESKSLSQS